MLNINILPKHRVSNTNLTIPLDFCEEDERSLNIAWAKNINFVFLSSLI
jgi:hypothetical protein